MKRSRLTHTAALAAAALFALTACGADEDPLGGSGDASGSPQGPLVVGSADFPESQVLAEIYAGALAGAGIEAETRLNIGSREIYFSALQDGSIDIIPDYSGNLLLFADPAATEESAGDILDALPEALAEASPDMALGVLEAAEAENKDAMVVTAATAEKHGLVSLEDMAAVCDQLVIGAPSTFEKRPYGLPGLEENYGCVPERFEPINDGGGAVTLEALLKDEIQAADIYTTTPSIEDHSLVVLEDPKNNFIAQQVLPLVNTGTVGEEAADVLNRVSGALTTEDLISLNREVSGDEKRSPADAAAGWLQENGFAG
jgi:osmoprotectant transport system substrate-binding protein